MPFDNSPVVASLTIDRATPLSNTEGTAGRGRLGVLVDNDTTEPIPVVVQNPTTMGTTANIYDESLDVAAGGEVDIVSYTVPPAMAFMLLLCEASSNNIAEYTVSINDVPFAKKRTYYSGGFNVDMEFFSYKAQPGDVIKVKGINKTLMNDNCDFNARIVGTLQND